MRQIRVLEEKVIEEQGIKRGLEQETQKVSSELERRKTELDQEERRHKDQETEVKRALRDLLRLTNKSLPKQPLLSTQERFRPEKVEMPLTQKSPHDFDFKERFKTSQFPQPELRLPEQPYRIPRDANLSLNESQFRDLHGDAESLRRNLASNKEFQGQMLKNIEQLLSRDKHGGQNSMIENRFNLYQNEKGKKHSFGQKRMGESIYDLRQQKQSQIIRKKDRPDSLHDSKTGVFQYKNTN